MTGLTPGTTYDVWVVYNCASDYWYSSKTSIGYIAGCVPGLPATIATGPTVSNVVGHCRQITASWAPVSGATSSESTGKYLVLGHTLMTTFQVQHGHHLPITSS
jgi:hypothetical protein